MLHHAQQLTQRVIEERHLNRDSLVIEIASNDGYLLTNYVRAGIPVLGVEPARNVARAAVERGVPTLIDFFGESLAQRLKTEGRSADVIHANNVLAHVPDLHGFMAGMSAALKPNGVAIVEVPYVKEMIDRSEFDTIYHEHLCYFSVTALDRLTARHNLLLQHIERIPIHGGSLRCFIQPRSKSASRTRELDDVLQQEAEWGVCQPEPYEQFANSVRVVTRELVDLLTQIKLEGKRVAAYGAAAKGSTLLNYAGVGGDVLDFVVDRSPHKQGRFMPGVRLPILPTERLVELMPDYVVLLTWNFADEILAQQDRYRRQGGRFIIPLPQVTVV